MIIKNRKKSQVINMWNKKFITGKSPYSKKKKKSDMSNFMSINLMNSLEIHDESNMSK